LEKAKNFLENTHDSIAEISNKCGFSDANYFARVFKKSEGVSPTQYQQQALESKKRRGSILRNYLI